MSQRPAKKDSSKRLVALWALAVFWLVQPGSLLACSACYGQSDSAMARGMNWGILTLLAVIVSVLGGIAGFFVFLARRSANNGLATGVAHSNSSLHSTTEI